MQCLQCVYRRRYRRGLRADCSISFSPSPLLVSPRLPVFPPIARRYGVDMIYHASFISDSTMEALEAQKERVFVAPALAWLVCAWPFISSFFLVCSRITRRHTRGR